MTWNRNEKKWKNLKVTLLFFSESLYADWKVYLPFFIKIYKYTDWIGNVKENKMFIVLKISNEKVYYLNRISLANHKPVIQKVPKNKFK